MKAASLRIGPGIQKGQNPLAAPAYVKEQVIERWQDGDQRVSEIPEPHAREIEDGRRDREANHGCSQVRLFYDQDGKYDGRNYGGQQGVPPVVD